MIAKREQRTAQLMDAINDYVRAVIGAEAYPECTASNRYLNESSETLEELVNSIEWRDVS